MNNETAPVVTMFEKPIPFAESSYNSATLALLIGQGTSTILADPDKNLRYGQLVFLTNDDTQDSRMLIIKPMVTFSHLTPITDILNGFRSYLLRTTKEGAEIALPDGIGGMAKEMWSGFAATVVACQNQMETPPLDLQGLSDIMSRSYMGDQKQPPILLCKVNFSISKNTLRVWDVAVLPAE